MKVLFFVHTLNGGGVEKVLFTILEILPKDIEVTLLVWRMEGKGMADIPKKIKVVHLHDGNDILSKNILIRSFQKLKRKYIAYQYKKNPEKIRKIVGEDFDKEIIFYHELASIWKSIQKKDTVVWVHGMLTGDNVPIDFSNLIHDISTFESIVCVSQAIKNGAAKVSDTFNNKAQVIYNPIDKNEIIKKSYDEIVWNYDMPVFLSVGRLSPFKGFREVLEIHKKLLEEGLLHKVIIVGHGEEYSYLKTRIQELGVSDTYILLGYQSNPYPYIRNADYFFLYSQFEGYPLVIEEAKLLGKAIIATDVGGIPEILENEKTGLVIPRNEEAMYHAMKRLLTDPALKKSLEENCRAASECYDENAVYEQIMNVILR